MESIPRFESSMGTDPEEWLKQFRLIAKLNKWDAADWVDLAQLKLGKRELVWYKKNVATFSDWVTFTVEFKSKFASAEQGYVSYDKLKEIKQENYESIEELEFALESALSKAGIEDTNAKYNWLVSSLSSDIKIKVRDNNLQTWDAVVKWIADREKDVEKEGKQASLSRKVNSGSGEYKEILERMEQLSLNLLSKVDEAVEKKFFESRRNRYQRTYPRVVTCFHCRKEGHKKYECPKLKEAEDKSESKYTKNVNFLELAHEDISPMEILAVQRRAPGNKQSTPYTRKEAVKIQDSADTVVNNKYVPNAELSMQIEDPDPARNKVSYRPKNNLKQEKFKQEIEQDNVAEASKTKVKTEIKMAEGIEPFSLVDQLAKWNPTISFPQLMSVAPSLNSEMISLCKKTKKQEINELKFARPRTTNCRIIVTVYNKEIWAVVDTGAACSVATPRMVEGWGLIMDEENDQVIITADGMRHHSLGTVRDIPLRIGNNRFTTNLTIMQRKDDSLILGMDWLMRHQAQLNIKDSELRLPLERIMLIVPLHTQDVPGYEECEESELFLMLKENQSPVDDSLKYSDPRIEAMKADNSDIFASDLEQLTQTDQAEHRIILKDDTPIKLKPYRIPHHLYTKITGRVARWAMMLRNYDYTIEHCPGKTNPADALSRLVSKDAEESP
ncbi:Protein DDI1-like protein, partial [Zancudomyces culisetae]